MDEEEEPRQMGLPSKSRKERVKASRSSGQVSGTTGMAEHDLPSIDEQVAAVMDLANDSQWMKEGSKGYIVSARWLSRVTSRSSSKDTRLGTEKFGKEAAMGPIGPVDNSDLWVDVDAGAKWEDETGENFVFIKKGLAVDEYAILPKDAWDLIVKWYGLAEGSPVITRYCHNTTSSETMENVMFEMQPPLLTIKKLANTMQSFDNTDTRPVKLLSSRHQGYQAFLKTAKTLTGIDIKTKVRVWRITRAPGTPPQDSLLTPAQSRSGSPVPEVMPSIEDTEKLIMDPQSFAALKIGERRELVDAKDETANANYNGKATMDLMGLCQNETIVLEEMIGGPAGGEWQSDTLAAKSKANGISITVTKSGTASAKDASRTDSRNASPAPTGMMTRGRQSRMGKNRGTVGLGNLGNTCYMNSALQCVRSVEELTCYFLDDKYKKELNPSNPLGNHGDVARTYAKLLHEMYDSKVAHSFSPRSFKNVIGKYGPSFSGYQQQDSQEFLLFLLDGLQEDLNRIDKKPYIEKPDSTDEMVHDQQALREMADTCWDIYKRRNDSVITDLFAGMYKSTLHCPVCEKVSIIFDPFNNLTLQLPIQNIWSKNLRVYPLRAAPFEVAVDIDKNSSWASVRDFIAKRTGLDTNKLLIAELWQHKFYKFFDLGKSINEDNPSDSDTLGCFELEDQPTNYPGPRKTRKTYGAYATDGEQVIPESDSPMADRMLVSVFNRRSKGNSMRGQSKEFFGDPALLILTRQEARDADAVLRKCLSRTETMTTRNFLREEDGEAILDDPEAISSNADDSSDSRVQTESLESEDGIVDVSMKEASSHDNKDDSPVPKFDRKPFASMLKPGAFITPAARGLFHMKTYSPGTEIVPLGFQAFMNDTEQKLVSIESRALAAREVDQTSTVNNSFPGDSLRQHMATQANDTPPTSDEDEEELTVSHKQSDTMSITNDGEESDGLPDIQQIIQPAIPTTTSSYISKAPMGYGRKDKRKARQAMQTKNALGERSASKPDEPLVRLGECIVLDWTNEGYDALFSGTGKTDDKDSPSRGAPTWEMLPVHEDPELEKSRVSRANRRKHGFSLGDCLDEFGKPEILSENDAWYCPRCKEHRRASKTFELWKAPDILVIHLKRFSAQGRFNNKIDCLVDFPLEGLDLSSRLATKQEDGKSPIYELFAVDNHYGGLGGGHYTAFAKNFMDQNWYEYNDSLVSRKGDTSVITPAAYLLFYRRVSDKPLGGPMFERNLANSDDATPFDSQSASRNASPSGTGEGRRLDESSRNGSSGALHEAGVAHQAGVGGQVGASPTKANPTTIRGQVLPGYSDIDQRGRAFNGMEVDEAIDMTEPAYERSGAPRTGGPQDDAAEWSFSKLEEGTAGNSSQTLQAQHHNSDADGDADSVKALSDYSDLENDTMKDLSDNDAEPGSPFDSPRRATNQWVGDSWVDEDEVMEIPPPQSPEEERADHVMD